MCVAQDISLQNQMSMSSEDGVGRYGMQRLCSVFKFKRRVITMVNAVFKSNIKVTRKPGHAYDTSFNGFFNNSKGVSTIPTGPVDLSFEYDIEPISAQLWNTLKTIISSKVA